ncbi:MAG: type IA DNA topoisomerase [Lachnospiraceae bacterium]|nr:type IA DNA topoisomerase [Lachnospiraceae bacterium]
MADEKNKKLYIAEKPSVAREFANALGESMRNGDGFMEGDSSVVTWCVGHLITLSYPDAYDEKYKKWSFETLPFLPEEFKYEVIDSSKKQFEIVKKLLNREDVDTIYICTDSGREGEYIYRLVDMMSGVPKEKSRKRVWIDSQTKEEILRGIREAKDWSAYDNLSDAAYLRAMEDYLMGINFSRALSKKYGYKLNTLLSREKGAIAVGRVMTCVLGMIVTREREIRDFKKTPFYRVIGNFGLEDQSFTGEWKAVEGSTYFESPKLYKENGFKEKTGAEELIALIGSSSAYVDAIERKKENKNPPLLYNLAELQNDCSKFFKISPSQTLDIAQELYEKKLTTYPRTDARVLSTAVSKEIDRNIGGLKGYGPCAEFAAEVLEKKMYTGLAKTRYVNDKAITDHYAIIPTGQGLGNLRSLNPTSAKVYELIVRRFLSIFYPAAVYKKTALTVGIDLPEGERKERFFSNFKLLDEEGYLKVAGGFAKKDADDDKDNSSKPDSKKAEAGNANAPDTKDGDAPGEGDGEQKDENENTKLTPELTEILLKLKKGDTVDVKGFEIKEGETSPPKRYTSGSMILAMENAGQLIEDEELRSQIKGSGIGTSATRAETLSKLTRNEYIKLNNKTQVLTPTLLGEMIYEVVYGSITALLNPALTASWEKGLSQVTEGSLPAGEYKTKLYDFVSRRTSLVKDLRNVDVLNGCYNRLSPLYKTSKSKK